MQYICSIVKDYRIIQDALDRIEKNIHDSDWFNRDDYHSGAVDYFTAAVSFVANVRTCSRPLEPHIIEAEGPCDQYGEGVADKLHQPNIELEAGFKKILANLFQITRS